MTKFGPLVSTSVLQRNLHNPEWCVVDCRFDLMNPSSGRSAWLRAHIPGARYADLNDDLAGPVTATSGRHPLPSVDIAAAAFGRLGIGSGSKVVVYDGGSGAIAARAWWMLRWLGHRRVSLLDGGFAAWVAEQRLVEAGAVETTSQSFVASPAPERILTTASIEERLGNGDEPRLVDARDAARFRGEHEPMDTIAGHIPGAINLPFSCNLRSDGRWKAKDELRALWSDAVGTRLDRTWGVMCGSGVTACHLVLCANLAGLPEPQLYVGSWSEWIRGPERPVATGL